MTHVTVHQLGFYTPVPVPVLLGSLVPGDGLLVGLSRVAAGGGPYIVPTHRDRTCL